MIVTLPEGLTINPDAADGQTMCTDDQANFGSEAAGECPDQAKIGTIALGTPALDGPLIGSIYIGEPQARQSVPPLHDPQRVRDQREAGRLDPPGPGDRTTHGDASRTCRRFRSTTSTSTCSRPIAV